MPRSMPVVLAPRTVARGRRAFVVVTVSTIALAGAALVVAPSVAGAPDAHSQGRADAIVELGRRLFFDPAISRSGENSCGTCHQPDHGFSSRDRIDDDDFTKTRRHSQPLLDLAGGRAFHWDGEFDSISELVALRLGEPSGASGQFTPTDRCVGRVRLPDVHDREQARRVPHAPDPEGPGAADGSDSLRCVRLVEVDADHAERRQS